MTGLAFLAPSILVANLLDPLILRLLWSSRRHPSAVLPPCRHVSLAALTVADSGLLSKADH
jgi:hypothetical protein